MIISEREFPLQSKSNFLDIMYVAEVIKKGLFPLWVTKELLSTENYISCGSALLGTSTYPCSLLRSL